MLEAGGGERRLIVGRLEAKDQLEDITEVWATDDMALN